jgi:uncharacterized protein (DUF1330 family)
MSAKGYLVAFVDVTDPEKYAEYTAGTPDAIAAHGGRYIVRGGQTHFPEGPARTRHAVIEFPSFAAAKAFYDSDAYQTLLPIALGASVRELVLVEGVAAAD